jgi:hypothetical protein
MFIKHGADYSAKKKDRLDEAAAGGESGACAVSAAGT